MPNRKSFPSDADLKKKHPGDMSVKEAGHLGGEKVRELIEKGEAMEKGRGKNLRAS